MRVPLSSGCFVPRNRKLVLYIQRLVRLWPILVSALAVLAPPAVNAADAPGIANFQQVDAHVYRGAQPTAEGFRSLTKLGVKTIIDLREAGSRSRAEKQLVEAQGMRYVSVPMDGWRSPQPGQMDRVLAVMNDPAASPVFVHCRRGKDRTGTVMACYRIAHDRWPNRKALDEARSLGMGWYRYPMKSYILAYASR